ncbi:MAG: AarF/ABC1/UbiB kinase family protein [Verrucomicrobia bacterium]|nr:MAG: AarF/ABC1/UbiB kinase family protein [Verrucomicrobiota bacterium]
MNPFDLISNAGRAREIATVLIRNGFADLLQRLEPPAGWMRRFVPAPEAHLNTWERIRKVLEELGPTFVKFGQILSMRPDVLPEPLILELRKLQDRVAVQPREAMEPVLRAGLPRPPEEIFSEFDETPVASASLAQVYFARLRDTGAAVAVKVQRPGIRATIEADFEILEWFAHQAHRRVSELRPYNLPGIMNELREGLERELDFRIEARNADFFNYQNPAPEEVFAPRPYEELTSRTVLVMERVTGRKLDSFEPGSEMAVSLAQTGARSIFHQILVSGFFHADPHGGNIVVTDDGRLCFLDWGLVGQLTRRMRYTLVDLFGAFLQGDSGQVVRIAMDLGRASHTSRDIRHMEREILFALRETLNPATGKGQIGRALLRLLHIFGSYDIEIGQDYALVAKAVLSVEEVGTALDPDFNLQSSFRPAVEALLRERRDPMEMWRAFRRSLVSGVARLQDLPAEMHRVLRSFEEGTATINFQHRGLEDLDEAINDASNKITVGVIIAALIVGSSLILTTDVRPHLFGFPLIGILGYLLSGVLGLWVVFDILRRRRR